MISCVLPLITCFQTHLMFVFYMSLVVKISLLMPSHGVITPTHNTLCQILSSTPFNPLVICWGQQKTVYDATMSRQPLQEAWTIDWLNSELAINLGLAIGCSTHESYVSAPNSYITFCHIHGFKIEPSQQTLAYYVTFQSSHINPRSIDSYLSGVCNQLESHFPDVWNTHKSPMAP